MIEEFLKNNAGGRISNNDKWLVWGGEDWVVFQHRYGSRKTMVYHRGVSFTDALKALAEE